MVVPRFLGLVALTFTSYTSALVLQPIRPRPLNLERRDAQSALNLQNSEIFLYGAQNAASIANFTVSFPQDTENVLSMERFTNMLSSVSCTNTSMTIKFNDAGNFAYAQKVWDWVNGADNHSFVMVAGAGDCHWNQNRQPFTVSTITYDEAANVAYLKALAQDWKTVVHTYELHVGHVPQDPNSVARRFLDFDKEKDFTMDLAHQFPFTTKFADPTGISVGVTCTKNCQTTGQLAIEAHLRAGLFSGLEEASVTIVPHNVSTTVETQLFLAGKIVTPFQYMYPIAQIPLDGLGIPDIADFGPTLEIDAGFAIGQLDASLNLVTGATATISDDSLVYFDLANPGNHNVSGWVPDVEKLPTSVSAKLSTGVSVFINTGAQLEASVLNEGWKVGLNLKAPNVALTVSAIDSLTQNACPNTNATAAISAQVDIGAEFDIAAQTADGSEVLFQFPLFSLPHKTFGPFCQAIF